MNMRRMLAKALLNVAFLWLFWTPFLTFFVVPLIKAQIQQGLCWAAYHEVLATWYRPELSQLAEYLNGNKDASDELSGTSKSNTLVLVLFWIISSVVIVLCVAGARQLDKGNFWTNVRSGLIILVFISLIEIGMFAGVAMRYNPFTNVDLS